MASTATELLRLQDQANSENEDQWGDIIDANLRRLEDAISRVTAIATTGGTLTLTALDYDQDESRSAFIDISGTLTSNATVVVPNVSKGFEIRNSCTGAYTLTFKTADGTGVVIPQGRAMRIRTIKDAGVVFSTPPVNPSTGKASAADMISNGTITLALLATEVANDQANAIAAAVAAEAATRGAADTSEYNRATAAEAAIANDVGNLVTLSGRPVDSTHFGTIPGTIIPNNSNLLQALTALNTPTILEGPTTRASVDAAAVVGGTSSVALGGTAGDTNTGDYDALFGIGAGYHNTGDDVAAVGFGAAYSNTGDGVAALGRAAAYGNTGANVTAIGTYAALNNNQNNVTAIGPNAGSTNTGSGLTAIGYNAGTDNTAARTAVIGGLAGYKNTGADLTAIGDTAGAVNKGASTSLIGQGAGKNNGGAGITAIGAGALPNNGRDHVTAVGNSAVTERVWGADVNVTAFTAPDIITVPGHAFGATGTRFAGKFGGTAAPAPAVLGTEYGFEVMSSSTVKVLPLQIATLTNFGTSATLSGNTLDVSNSSGIGYNAQPDGPNQVVLGDTNIAVAKTAGAVRTGSRTTAALTNAYAIECGKGAIVWDETVSAFKQSDGAAWASFGSVDLTARSQASAAQATANTALSNAATAQSSANTASTAAAAAQTTANSATTLAGTKVGTVKVNGTTNGSFANVGGISSIATNLTGAGVLEITCVGISSGGGTCFPAGSTVLMADGTVREVTTVRAGEFVWSPSGPSEVERLHITTLGARAMWRMLDRSIEWSDEHSFYVDRNGDRRLWSMNVDRLMAEAEAGDIGGISDWEWMYEGGVGQGEQFVTVSGLKVNSPTRARNGYTSKTALYVPITRNGSLIAVSGNGQDFYVVGAGVDDSKCDYRNLQWGRR